MLSTIPSLSESFSGAGGGGGTGKMEREKEVAELKAEIENLKLELKEGRYMRKLLIILIQVKITMIKMTIQSRYCYSCNINPRIYRI